jgi:hypothetical protein
VFHQDGEIWFDGDFLPEPRGAAIDTTNVADFLGWDGERLHLTGGRSLRAVKQRR